MTRPSSETHVVFYDGVCRLCDRSVRFFLEMDRKRVLSFAPLQGGTAARLRRRKQLSDDMTTLLFVEHYGSDRERVWSRSAGVLRVLARIGGFWRIVSWLRIVPAPIRDLVYRTVARYRYRWFGRLESCRLPDADLSDRFLD